MTDTIRLEAVRYGDISAEVELSTIDEPLVIDIETAHRFGLVSGTVITASQAASLAAAAQRFACRREAMRLLALRSHAVSELRLKLRKRQFPEEAIREVIGDLRERGVLDDAQHAHRLAQSLVRRKPCGRSYLIAHLQDRHIARGLAEDTADAVLGSCDREAMAVQALRGRWREFGQFDLETARRKAYNYLARRGFGYEISQAAFERMVTESSNGGDD